MKIPPDYSITPRMLELISSIEALKLLFSSLNIPPEINSRIQRVSLLKSSLFSARIEGNPLELINFESGEDKKKLEVFNIMDAIKLVETSKFNKISKKLVLKLHEYILKNISPDAGHFREEPSAIFNSAGIAVYVSPSPSMIPKLLDNLLDYVNSDSEKFPLITAFIAHLVFEKIHPFLDGNGRVGRFFIATVLKVKGWGFSFTVPFEEYLDEHKVEYYYHLDKGLQHTNEYLTFMLEAYLYQLEKTREQVEEEVIKKEEVFLPPRQEEIMNIIKDHSVVSFDSIKRRFQKVPGRTLRYDLKKLVDRGLIEKTGETRGRYYRAKP